MILAILSYVFRTRGIFRVTCFFENIFQFYFLNFMIRLIVITRCYRD